MTVYIGEQRLARKNRLGRGSLISFAKAWKELQSHMPFGDLGGLAQLQLTIYKDSETTYNFDHFGELAVHLRRVVDGRGAPLSRQNKFYKEGGENNNVAKVIYQSHVPQSSAGWGNAEFFEKLGHPVNTYIPGIEHLSSSDLFAVATDDESTVAGLAGEMLRRRAEQEYLMQNMAKGPMWEAAQIATRKGYGIAVRGTGLLAHMGIESGSPTKAQEYKNKTSKVIDLFLCDELDLKDVGAVVHFDPRVGWTSKKAAQMSRLDGEKLAQQRIGTVDWKKKWEHIQKKRMPALMQLMKTSYKAPTEKELEAVFIARFKEYVEEDYEYRWGHYAPYTHLAGPLVRLKVRPKDNMYGDHDLFVFTDGVEYGKIKRREDRMTGIQTDLQEANAFQAQHGGIWYWKPGTDFNVNIRVKIMGAHSPDDGEPLVYICPNNLVTAAFYMPPGSGRGGECLKSVWACKKATKWLKTTHSGEFVATLVNAGR